MLRNRVIGVLVVRSGLVVQSIGFRQFLPVGIPSIAVEYLNRWGIDEIILLDIDATLQERAPTYEQIAAASQFCRVPLAVGGGVQNCAHMEGLIRAGADKIVLNAASVETPELITQGAKQFGSQCMVVSIDARKHADDRYEAFTRGGRLATGKTPAELARQAEAYGAGEILINSIDRDGSKQGYDLCLVEQVINATHLPVIICGGVGHPEHLRQGLRLPVSGVAAANFWHYTEHSVVTVKRYLAEQGANIRLDSYVTYADTPFREDGRIAKVEDVCLQKLRFTYLPEEVI